MKGLLLKDFYMLWKHCKAYLVFIIIFTGSTFLTDDYNTNLFFPCLIIGMIPIMLINYDETSKWNQYCRLLPYKPSHVVLSKYLIGLFAQCFVVLFVVLAQIVWLGVNGSHMTWELFSPTPMILCMSLIPASLGLPLIYRFGVEKGRILSAVILGILFATIYPVYLMWSLEFLDDSQAVESFPFPWLLPILCAILLGIYCLSIVLSISFYKKREI